MEICVPVEFKVLIRVDEIEDKSAGGIYLTENTKSQDQFAHARGVLIDVGGMAFQGFDGEVPKIGDRVMFNKYQGTTTTVPKKEGRGFVLYRLCNDKDIIAILREGEYE
jgi:chaperonin GroES